jgi:hypothetical protein
LPFSFIIEEDKYQNRVGVVNIHRQLNFQLVECMIRIAGTSDREPEKTGWNYLDIPARIKTIFDR